MSARAPSGFEFREEECNEEDLDDLEPVRSGGEPGTVGTKFDILSRVIRRGLSRWCKLIERLVPV